MNGSAHAGAGEPDVTHDEGAGRFELRQDDLVAVLEYELDGNQMAIFHTGVPRELEGRGIGGQLAKAALEHAKSRDLRVVPQCSFVRSYIARHPEYAFLVSE